MPSVTALFLVLVLLELLTFLWMLVLTLLWWPEIRSVADRTHRIFRPSVVKRVHDSTQADPYE